MYRLEEESQKGNNWSSRRLARPHIFSLTAELLLIRIAQNFYSSERLRRCNVRSNWAVEQSNFRYHRLFARIRRVIGKEL